jgi:hypothetical protein|tara:strand:+ start:15545 stop:15892 length:348 start_codon:yes stop_codon:yes gene_type:complete
MFLYKESINPEDQDIINTYKGIENGQACIIADHFNYIDMNISCFHSFFIGQMVNEYILVINHKDFKTLVDLDYNKQYIVLLDKQNIDNHVNYINSQETLIDIKYQIGEILNNEKL